MSLRLPALALAVALLGACATAPPPASPPPPPGPPAAAATVVPERYVSDDSPADELDSLATWTTEDGRTWLIATAKSTHRLVVYDADSGERLREVGTRGGAPGQFNRPNGVAVHGDWLFVVERDNHRVQVLSLPDFRPLGSFGEDALRSPYGLWIDPTTPDRLEVYVTDSFMYGPKYDQLPPPAELSRRVHRFRVGFDADGRVRARDAGTFGETDGPGALHIVESIAGDPANDRLLVADESQNPQASTLRVYTLAGRYTGRSLPDETFRAQAEGVALWSCTGEDGYWIAVDQLSPLTVFHLFDRRSLQPAGSFRGQVTAHTDGIALHAAATPSFPDGALFAVSDDKAVTAFDLRDVARALHLSPGCGGE